MPVCLSVCVSVAINMAVGLFEFEFPKVVVDAPPPPPQLLLKVFVVARAIFKRRNLGAAEDRSVKVLIVARAIFSGFQAPKKLYCGARRPGRKPDPDRAQA